MKEHYVSYSQAVKLKEFGFNWEAYGKYVDCPNDPTLFNGMIYQPWNLEPDEIIAPTLAQAVKWLREVKGWHIQVRINGVRSAYWYEIWSTIPNGPVYGTPDDDTFRRGQYDSYEEALSAGIDKALELLGKENNNGM